MSMTNESFSFCNERKLKKKKLVINNRTGLFGREGTIKTWSLEIITLDKKLVLKGDILICIYDTSSETILQSIVCKTLFKKGNERKVGEKGRVREPVRQGGR